MELQRCARQTALAGQDLSRTYLAHHELESIIIIIVVVVIFIVFFYFYCHDKWVGVQGIDPESWDMIFDRMRALPPSKH